MKLAPRHSITTEHRPRDQRFLAAGTGATAETVRGPKSQQKCCHYRSPQGGLQYRSPQGGLQSSAPLNGYLTPCPPELLRSRIIVPDLDKLNVPLLIVVSPV